MTPVALIFQDLGKQITGSDTTASQITDAVLEQRGITILEFNEHNITPEINLVVYSGAYRLDHPELEKAKSLDIPVISQAEALAAVTRDKKLVAVCGVGGKTTTSAMLATVFQKAHTDPSWFVGVSTFNNDWVPGRFGGGEYFIAEADEYAISPQNDPRPKFALYSPRVIVCTNILHDHPDIYPTFEDTLAAFTAFFNKLPEDGLLLIRPKDLALIKKNLRTQCRVITYDLEDSTGDYKIAHMPDDSFYVTNDEYRSPTIFMQTVGEHNILNAASSFIVARELGLSTDSIIEGLQSFSSSKRRLEKVGYKDGVLYYDDYGHHPFEIKKTLEALKKRFLDKRIITVFNPHTYSRTKALFNEYIDSFNHTDILIVDDIFSSARESSDPSISGEILANAIKTTNPNTVYLGSRENIVTYLQENRKPGDVIITLGAGDVYKIHQELLK